MANIRLSCKRDIPRLKEIWKLCFGDSDEFIDFYYANEYNPDQTLVLLDSGEVAAMLTMLPVWLRFSGGARYNSSMLYAIATHPKHQKKGYSTALMEYAKEYLQERGAEALVLVPAQESLIEFYQKRGYQSVFFTREAAFDASYAKELAKDFNTSVSMVPATPAQYNSARNHILQGQCFVAYDLDGILYQKRLSQKSGADIFVFSRNDGGDIIGCAAIERGPENKVIVKELLVPERWIRQAVLEITKILPAKEYILRMPKDFGKVLGGKIRSFGMLHALSEDIKKEFKEPSGYLGIAYD